MWSLRSPWCSEHLNFLVCEHSDKFQYSLHHLLAEGFHLNPNQKKTSEKMDSTPLTNRATFGRKKVCVTTFNCSKVWGEIV